VLFLLGCLESMKVNSMANEVCVETDQMAAGPLFDSEAARQEAARGLGVHLDVLPKPGVVLGSAAESEEAEAVEAPKLTDTEWELIEPVLRQWEGIKPSRVHDRAFIDYCMAAAQLKFHWTLLIDPDAEACRKRAERMATNETENRWRFLYYAVSNEVRPEVAAILREWVAQGDFMRDRTFQRREQRRKKLLFKAN
jgi:hypothetical protein